MSVFEFIGGEHTAKNVMLTASKRPIGRESSGAEIEDLRARLRQLSAEFGVERQALAFFEKHLQKQAANVQPATGFLDAADFPLLFTPAPAGLGIRRSARG